MEIAKKGSSCIETFGKKINIDLHKFSPPTISFQLDIFCTLEEFQDICVIIDYMEISNRNLLVVENL